MKAELRTRSKTIVVRFIVPLAMIFLILVFASHADPITNCWFTADSGQYARIYTNAAMQAAGTPITTWSNGSQVQSLPAYCGIQEIYSSSNWVYVRSTGLASYNMGPWYLNSQHNLEFPNLPVNQKNLYRIPRTNSVPTTKSITGGGQIGIFVDGVAMFNSWDAYTWDPGTGYDTNKYTGYWNRDAYVNEGSTFDAGNAHQQQTGTYHYHADPIGLRYQLGDHVDYDPTTKTYYEDTNPPTQHSPILGWVADGFPIYGPYGYSNPTNPASGIRRMVSGYVPRNGQNGTDNLDYNGTLRTTIPAWVQRLFPGLSAAQSGPIVSSSYPFGRYMEDNAYLGDLTNAATGSNYVQGVDFDLDQYNGRWCVTPDFPNGTYAYFVAIDSNGMPVFPYDIGRGYYGSPTGGQVGSITETVATNFLGDTNLPSTLAAPVVNNETVTLTWSALEGGSYSVQSKTSLGDASWATVAANVAPNKTTGSYTDVTAVAKNFYRVGRTAVASFDSAGTTLFATPVSVASGSVTDVTNGVTYQLTITLPTTPPLPPINQIPTSVAVGSVTVTSNISRTGTNTVQVIVPLAGAISGTNNVVVAFNPAPAYTLADAVDIH